MNKFYQKYFWNMKIIILKPILNPSEQQDQHKPNWIVIKLHRKQHDLFPFSYETETILPTQTTENRSS